MGKTLSDAAITDISRMKADIRRLLAAVGLPEKTLQTGPPHYLVLTPVGGIPAADTGVPGDASCQIARRWGTDKDIQDTNSKVTVYNASDVAIDAGVHVLAHRDAWGDYYVGEDAPAGTGAEIIFIKAPEGGIPPRASNLLGSATCDKYVINANGQLEDSTDDVTVVNWATTAVCSNGLRYGVAAFFDGEWVVISEDCADESGPVQPAGGGYTSGTILSDFPDLESTITPQFGFYTSGSHSRSSNVTGGFE